MSGTHQLVQKEKKEEKRSGRPPQRRRKKERTRTYSLQARNDGPVLRDVEAVHDLVDRKAKAKRQLQLRLHGMRVRDRRPRRVLGERQRHVLDRDRLDRADRAIAQGVLKRHVERERADPLREPRDRFSGRLLRGHALRDDRRGVPVEVVREQRRDGRDVAVPVLPDQSTFERDVVPARRLCEQKDLFFQ